MFLDNKIELDLLKSPVFETYKEDA